ncbi:hypothetical protein F5Y12DRAFT_715615 [Xylaria sp. FL1777]|nr:hypothetical protein F5Y12DRAFT_715615 [Xylaria sp. FL1777]
MSACKVAMIATTSSSQHLTNNLSCTLLITIASATATADEVPLVAYTSIHAANLALEFCTPSPAITAAATAASSLSAATAAAHAGIMQLLLVGLAALLGLNR